MELRDRSQEQLLANFQLARSLGAEVVSLKGQEVASLVVEYARANRYTRILVGKTPRRRLFAPLRAEVADQIMKLSGDIDVYVVQGAPEEKTPEPVAPQAGPVGRSTAGPRSSWRIGVAAAFGIHLLGWSQASVIMVLLVSVVYISARFGSGPSIAASILATLLFNFLFTEPYYSLNIRDPQNIITFLAFLVISLTLRTLASTPPQAGGHRPPAGEPDPDPLPALQPAFPPSGNPGAAGSGRAGAGRLLPCRGRHPAGASPEQGLHHRQAPGSLHQAAQRAGSGGMGLR